MFNHAVKDEAKSIEKLESLVGAQDDFKPTVACELMRLRFDFMDLKRQNAELLAALELARK